MAVRKALPYLDITIASVPGTANVIVSLNVDKYKTCNSIKVIDGNSEKLLTVDMDNKYKLTIHGKTVLVSPEWLVLFTFSPLYKSEKFFDKFQVTVLDKTLPINYHPGNLTWVTVKDGVEDPDKPGFCIPPYYSGVCVSKDGQVWTRRMNRFCTVRESSNGKGNNYFNTSVTSNGGHVDTVGMHRIIAMAYFPLESSPFSMTVNHKNGVKSENTASNLEWASYQENNLHAKEAGLNKNRRPIYCRDYLSNTVTHFRSAAAVGLQLGINDGSVSALVNYGGIHKNRYEFIDAEHHDHALRTWNTEAFKDAAYDMNNPKQVEHVKFTRRLAVFDTEKVEVTIYENQYQVAAATGISPADVLKAIQRVIKVADNTLIVCYKDEVLDIVKRFKNGDKSLFKRINNILPGKNKVKVERLTIDGDVLSTDFHVIKDVKILLRMLLPTWIVNTSFKKLNVDGKVEAKGFRITIVNETEPQSEMAVE